MRTTPQTLQDQYQRTHEKGASSRELFNLRMKKAGFFFLLWGVGRIQDILAFAMCGLVDKICYSDLPLGV